jgi:putative tricarboxylic transport membrane protein
MAALEPGNRQAPSAAPVIVERLLDVLWLVVSIVVLVLSSRLGMGSAFGPGPGFFPMLLGGVLLLFAVLRLAPLAVSIARCRAGPLPGLRLSPGERRDALRFVLLTASIFVYAALLETFGFTVMTLLLCWAVLLIFGRRWHWSLLAALVAAVLLRIGFGTLLEVQLPVASLPALAGLGL